MAMDAQEREMFEKLGARVSTLEQRVISLERNLKAVADNKGVELVRQGGSASDPPEVEPPERFEKLRSLLDDRDSTIRHLMALVNSIPELGRLHAIAKAAEAQLAEDEASCSPELIEALRG